MCDRCGEFYVHPGRNNGQALRDYRYTEGLDLPVKDARATDRITTEKFDFCPVCANKLVGFVEDFVAGYKFTTSKR